MMRSLFLYLACLLGLAIRVQCYDFFLMPANYDNTDRDINNPRYKIGDEIKVMWVADENVTSIRVVQGFPNTTQQSYWLEIQIKFKTIFWTIDFDNHTRFDKNAYGGQDCIFWFEIKGEAIDILATSRSFNVSVSDTDSDSDSRLSAGAGAGIAVGAIFGGLMICGVGFLAWRHFSNSKAGHQSQGEDEAQKLQTLSQNTPQSGYQYSPSPEISAFAKPELHNEPAKVYEAP
ncbi:Crumbs protein like protein 3 [Fusarium austroafricanum]|uniref:Crumbs protein like protein 3 n=1 Tax=Fusarium austroafricanum TaxID=2364996 RepID=A0A8H4JS14_9HYPO|nr:Crumbs protein like protein 3 [Fusarium austroafricanum]